MGVVVRFGQGALAVMVCLSLWVWSAAPAAGHGPTAVDTVQHHLAAIAQDGKADSSGPDPIRALHGLGCDALDHDHGQVMPAVGGPHGQAIIDRETWRPPPHPGGPTRLFLIERPPRA